MVFTCFMLFLLNTLIIHLFRTKGNITLLFIKANDSPFEFFLQTLVWQGSCSTRKNNSYLCENLRDDPSAMTTNEKHTRQNHCQQKTFNLIFKKRSEGTHTKSLRYSKTYLEVDTIDVWHSCTSGGRVVSTMLVPFHKISKWRQGDHVVPISPPPAPVQQRSQHH